jgi:hypothetical protein
MSRGSELVTVLIDDSPYFANLSFAHAHVSDQFDRGLQPELRLSVGAHNVHMHARLFAGEEEKPISALSMNRRRHSYPILQPVSHARAATDNDLERKVVEKGPIADLLGRPSVPCRLSRSRNQFWFPGFACSGE